MHVRLHMAHGIRTGQHRERASCHSAGSLLPALATAQLNRCTCHPNRFDLAMAGAPPECGVAACSWHTQLAAAAGRVLAGARHFRHFGVGEGRADSIEQTPTPMRQMRIQWRRQFNRLASKACTVKHPATLARGMHAAGTQACASPVLNAGARPLCSLPGCGCEPPAGLAPDSPNVGRPPLACHWAGDRKEQGRSRGAIPGSAHSTAKRGSHDKDRCQPHRH